MKNDEKQRIVPISSQINFGTYHEALPDSFSFSLAKKGKDGILFDYQLTTAKEEPFSGLFFYNGEDFPEDFFRFMGFDRLNLELTTKYAQRIPITFTLNYEGFTDSVPDLGNLPLNYLLEVEPGRNTYILDLTEFEIPSWWLRHHQLEKKDFPALDLNRVNYIVVGTCQLLGGGKADQIIVHELTVDHSNQFLMYLLGGMALVDLMIFGVLYLVRKRKKVVVPVYGTEVRASTDPASLIQEYLAKHYMDPDLTPELLQKELGISTRSIGEEIKRLSNTNFKGYLNALRMAEVRRLLLKTDLSVSEIAYQCGYSNISHFNRVFKQMNGKSPKQFREEGK